MKVTLNIMENSNEVERNLMEGSRAPNIKFAHLKKKHHITNELIFDVPTIKN